MATVPPASRKRKQAFTTGDIQNQKEADTETRRNAILTNNSKQTKNNSFKCETTKPLGNCLQEANWELDDSEALCDPVPDLYPELRTDPLNMQNTETEREDTTTAFSLLVGNSVDSEENVQCVPTDDRAPTADANEPCTSEESQDTSQISEPHSKIKGSSKRQRKPSKPKRVRLLEEDDISVEEPFGGKTSESDVPPNASKLGTWAQCSIPSCGKWRCLKDSVDPRDIPERWVCSMSTDDNFNSCAVSQETFDSQDENFDVVYSPYTSGTIVWAKLAGYPWWPSMMQDDPDYGYYCETGDDNVTPVSYHVVFFGKPVSRAWVNAACIRDFSFDDDPLDMGRVTFKGKNYMRQLTAATLSARKAVQLPPQGRLEVYGFHKRFKGAIGKKAAEETKTPAEEDEFNESASSQEPSSSGSSASIEEETKKGKRPLKPKATKKRPLKKQSKKNTPQTGGSPSFTKKQNGRKEKDKLKKTTTTKTSASTLSCTDYGHDNVFSENKKDNDVAGESLVEKCTLPVSDVVDNGCKDDTTTSVSGIKQLQLPQPSVVDCREKESAAVAEEQLPERGEATLTEGREENGKKRRLSSGGKSKTKRKTSKETDTSYDNGNNGDHKSTDQLTQDLEKDGVKPVEPLSSEGSRPVQEATEKQRKKVIKTKNISKDALKKETKLEISQFKTGSNQTLTYGEDKQETKGSVSSFIIPKGSSQGGSLDVSTTSGGIHVPASGKKHVSTVAEDQKQAGKGETIGSDDEQTIGSSTSGEREKAVCIVIPDKKSDEEQNRGTGTRSYQRKKSETGNPNSNASSEKCSQKKSMPKLIKAKSLFKPPVNTGENSLPRPSKMPKLVRPQFVSPAMVKSVAKSGKIPLQKSVQVSSTEEKPADGKKTVENNNSSLKRKSQDKGKQSRKVSKQEQGGCAVDNLLPEDLQLEMAEIDKDIASLKEELNEVDKSDTSPVEESFISPSLDQRAPSDSPEF